LLLLLRQLLLEYLAPAGVALVPSGSTHFHISARASEVEQTSNTSKHILMAIPG
jgi:hypothetical protein